MTFGTGPRTVFSILFVVLALNFPASVLGEPVAHRAAYSLSLGDADPGGRFIGIKGTVVVVHEKTCEAWITTERVEMAIDTRVGGQLTQELDYTGWESLDGRRYRFAARSRINDTVNMYKGSAFSNPDKPGEAAYSRPDEKIMTLPKGTLFYYGFNAWLVAQASAGASQAEAAVFDGTDGEGPQKAVAFIVPATNAATADISGLGPLVERSGWTMRIAFYPVEGRAATPEYEVQSLVLDNGVTARMELEFPGFTAIQKLERIEALATPKC